MEQFTSTYNLLASIGAIIFFIIGLITLFFVFFVRDPQNETLQRLKKNALVIGLIISWASLIGSLIYSMIIGYTPCELCYTQRIFIYPQAVIYLIALIKRDTAAFKYLLWLSLIGLVVAIYHNWISLGGTELVACGSTVVSCTKLYVNEFGFVTIPFMSLSSLLALSAISALGSKTK